MSTLRASRSPCSQASRYLRSSASLSGRGKEPPGVRRSIRNALLIISIRVLYSIFSPPFLPGVILFGGCKYTCLSHIFLDMRKYYTTLC